MNIIAYSSKELVDERLSREIFSRLEHLSQSRDDLIIALSGGSTPVALYRHLAKEMQENPLSANVHIIQVDERFVSKKSDRSNQKLIQELFSEVCTIHTMSTPDEIDDLEKAVQETQTKYLELFNTLGVVGPDICLLGMGADGHTASLFPHNEKYLNTINYDRGIIGMFVETQNENRISCNLNLINSSTKKILYAYGQEKLQTLQQALSENNTAKYPILQVIENIELYTVIHDQLLEFETSWKLTNQF